jgi:SAM-dependent methyltransferase
MSHADRKEITENFWGEAARGRKRSDYPVHWLQSPLVMRHCVNPRISGDPDLGWLEWVRREFVPVPAQAGFVLGCGGGNLERQAAALGLCRSFVGVDISPAAIEVARALAQREGWGNFRYEAEDANNLALDPGSLDLILADMSLHHIERLERLLSIFARALRPGGLAVFNEFVGPNRFQWTDEQIRAATRAIRSLPLRLRRNRDLVKWKRLAKPWVWKAKRWPPERVASMDPSESVRSAEIPKLVAEHFQVLHRADYGGSLLALALNNIVGNFRNCPEDIRTLEALAAEERKLIQDGILANDYTVIVASPDLR